jgi:hypothetical protein
MPSLGIIEYNCKLFEDAGTSDVFSGLWTIAAIGEMLYGGLDFAPQWDAFTQKRKTGGGHGFRIEQGAIPKAEYWALHLLSHYLGSELLPVEDSADALRTYASRDANGARGRSWRRGRWSWLTRAPTQPTRRAWRSWLPRR